MFWSVKVGKRRLWFPKPFIVGQLAGYVPGRFMEYAHTNDPQAFDGVVDLFGESVSPVGIEGFGNILPTTAKPVIEWLTNYNFFLGRNIVSPYKQDVKEKYKYNRFTSKSLKALGSVLGISPAIIENTIRGFTGSLGAYAVKGADAIASTLEPGRSGRPSDMSDLPVFRRFVGRKGVEYGETQRMFYESHKKIKKEYDELRRGGTPFMDANKLGSIFRAYNRKARAISALTKEEDKIIARDIDDKSKQKMLDDVAAKKKKLMKDALRLFKRNPKLTHLLG